MQYKFARWDITDKCNFLCTYCKISHRSTGHPEELSFEEIRDQLIPALLEANVWSLVLEGGEPTLKENLVDIIRLLRNEHIAVSMVTNGSRLNQEMCQQLVSLKMEKITISFDSHRYDVNSKTRVNHEVDHYDRQVEAITYLAKNANLCINTVVNIHNYLEIPELIDFLEKLGVREIHLMRESRELGKVYEFPLLSSEESLKLGVKVYEKIVQYSHIKIIPAFLTLKAKKYLNEKHATNFPLLATAATCSPGLKEIYLTSYGAIYPCRPFSRIKEIPIKRYFDLEPEQLNIRTNPIPEILKSFTYKKAFQESKNPWHLYSLRPCGKCEFMLNGCYTCFFNVLQFALCRNQDQLGTYDRQCAFIAKLNQEMFNHYRAHRELVWNFGIGDLTLYQPEEGEIRTFSEEMLYVWELLIKGYLVEEIAENVYKKYGEKFKDFDESSRVVNEVIQDLLDYNFIVISD